jgi:hypothetical protein
VLQGMIRGACIGLTLRGGLHLVGSLLAAVSKRRDRYVTCQQHTVELYRAACRT